MAKAFRFSLRAEEADITELDLGRDLYDIVILNQLLFHLPNWETTFETLDKAWDATKVGGHIWVRTPGKEDEEYEKFRTMAEYGQGIETDEDTFLGMCACTGEMRPEPFLFLDQTALLQYFCLKGARIIHSQIIPRFGVKNVMYGKDWQNEEGEYKQNGMLTILAQKK